MTLAIRFLNLCGHERVPDIDRLEEDDGLTGLVQRFEPALFRCRRLSLSRRFRRGRAPCFPSARSTRDWLECFHQVALRRVVLAPDTL